MFLKRLLFPFVILGISFSCGKPSQSTHIRLQIIDDDTNLPIPATQVYISALLSGTPAVDTYRNFVISGNAGDVNITVPAYVNNKSIEGNIGLIVFSDTPYNYYMKQLSAPQGKSSEFTVKLSRTSAIFLNYHPISSALKLDSLQWGVNQFSDFHNFWFDDYKIFNKYTIKRNLHNPPKGALMNSDTTIQIYCNPSSTTDYYYRVPGGIKNEKCSLQKNEIKMVDVYY